MPIVAVGALKYGTLVFEGQCNLDEIIGKMEREREREEEEEEKALRYLYVMPDDRGPACCAYVCITTDIRQTDVPCNLPVRISVIHALSLCLLFDGLRRRQRNDAAAVRRSVGCFVLRRSSFA